MKTMIITLAMGAGLASASVAAQQPGTGGGYMQRDQSRAEAQQRADMMFQMLDANKDGTVTKAEAGQALAQFEAMRGDGNNGRGAGRMQRMLEQAFATAPSLTKAQFEAQALTRFDAMDLNHDGTVTAAERQQARAARQQQVAPAVQPKVQ
jgi:Ca2+-binding EF-hand superfamily protein